MPNRVNKKVLKLAAAGVAAAALVVGLSVGLSQRAADRNARSSAATGVGGIAVSSRAIDDVCPSGKGGKTAKSKATSAKAGGSSPKSAKAGDAYYYSSKSSSKSGGGERRAQAKSSKSSEDYYYSSKSSEDYYYESKGSKSKSSKSCKSAKSKSKSKGGKSCSSTSSSTSVPSEDVAPRESKACTAPMMSICMGAKGAKSKAGKSGDMSMAKSAKDAKSGGMLRAGTAKSIKSGDVSKSGKSGDMSMAKSSKSGDMSMAKSDKSGKSGDKSGKSVMSMPTDICSDFCFEQSEDCTDSSFLPDCGEGIAVGERCRGRNGPDNRGDLFCGTNNETPNCPSNNGEIRQSVWVRIDCPSRGKSGKVGKGCTCSKGSKMGKSGDMSMAKSGKSGDMSMAKSGKADSLESKSSSAKSGDKSGKSGAVMSMDGCTCAAPTGCGDIPTPPAPGPIEQADFIFTPFPTAGSTPTVSTEATGPPTLPARERDPLRG